MTELHDDSRALRRQVYAILIAVGVGAMLGRVLAIDSVDKIGLEETRVREVLGGHRTVAEYAGWKRRDLKNRGLAGERLEAELAKAVAQKQEEVDEVRLRRPFLSGNDRSRLATVRALVEKDMRVEGAPYAIDKVIQEPGWDTIDMVKHARRYSASDAAAAASERRGEADSNSKKQQGSEEPQADERPWRQEGGHLYSSKPPLLPTLLAGEYWVVNRLTGMTLGDHPYFVGRIMLVVTNVIPLAIYFVVLAWLVERFGTTGWGRYFVMAAAVFGTFLTTFAVTINNHVPAAVCAAITLYAVVRIWIDGQRQARYFVLAGLFGALTVANELPAAALVAVLSLALLWKAPWRTLAAYAPPAALVAAGFFGTNWIAHRSLVPPYLHRGGGGPEDWYDYTYVRNGKQIESYWNDPQGVDAGEASWPKYAFHVTLGHHGIFSLTPIWILSVIGAGMWIVRGRDRRLRELAIVVAAVSLVCLAFYLQPQKGSDYRNYGGTTSGLRWMFWFAPLWLVVMLPAVDAMASRRWARAVALVLLAVSVLSVSFPTWNPWVAPWLNDYFAYFGWS